MEFYKPCCPKCHSEYPYQDGQFWICPDCSHEWSISLSSTDEEISSEEKIFDANGNELHDGDSVSIVKDLKVKGASGSLKVGTKVKNIKLVYDSGDGHNIACKIPGFGAMNLKSEVVKKI